MRLSKRIFAGILAVITTFSMVGCGADDNDNNKDSGSDSSPVTTTGQVTTAPLTTTITPTTELKPELPTDTVDKLAGTLQNKSLENTTITYFVSESISPKASKSPSIDSLLFAKKYNGVIEEKMASAQYKYDELAIAIISGDSPDFMSTGGVDDFPRNAKLMIQPINDYINFESELWKDVKDVSDMFSIENNHYISVIQVLPQYICAYNRNTIDENGYDDPAELFAKDEWTLDKFSEMCINFADSSKDIYGIDGFWLSQAIASTCGTPMISFEKGKAINNMASKEISEIQNFMYKLEENNVCYPKASNEWLPRGKYNIGTGVAEGKTLFYPVPLSALEQEPEYTKYFGNVDNNEIMFVPMPHNRNADKYYSGAMVDGYALCIGASNPQGFAAFMECKRVAILDSNAYRYTKESLKHNYGWNNEMVEMRESAIKLANTNPVYEFSYGISTDADIYFGNNISTGTMLKNNEGKCKTWDKILDEYKLDIDDLISKFNT